MAGIRLRHPEWHNCRVAITHPSLQLPVDPATGKHRPCLACGGVPHERKTIHLDFNTEGETFVSPEVLKLLREAGLWRFDLEVVNEVENPPSQLITLAGAPVALTEGLNEPIERTEIFKQHRGLIPRLTVWRNKRKNKE